MTVSKTSARYCWLCDRRLGQKVEWHHPLPKSKGGRETVPLHPICHRNIHATLSNTQLAGEYRHHAALTAQADIAKFIRWVSKKPPDFCAPTRRRKS